MITEKNNVFYCDCGFSFQRGRSGAHDCAVGLRIKLAESEARCAALAAENAGLKQAITTHSQSTHFCEVCGKDDPCSTDDVCYVLNETPATDAFLAEVRAQGVEMFAKEMHADISGDDAREFAAQIRKGAQS